MDKIVNVRMLSQPLNWVIVWLVLLFAGFAWTIVHERLQSLPVTTQTPAP
jgi:hypothetical protein